MESAVLPRRFFAASQIATMEDLTESVTAPS